MSTTIENKTGLLAWLGACVIVVSICGFACAFVLISSVVITGADRLAEPSQDFSSAVSNVIVNEVRLHADILRQLNQQYGYQIEDGRYWYDPVSGAWGWQGGPTAGFVAPNLEIGGPLRADASGGGTGVFINQRELHPQDVVHLEAILGPIEPGRYWLDAHGNAGLEGGPPIVNIGQLIQSVGSNADGHGHNPYYGNADAGNNFYFFDPGSGCSVMLDSGLSC